MLCAFHFHPKTTASENSSQMRGIGFNVILTGVANLLFSKLFAVVSAPANNSKKMKAPCSISCMGLSSKNPHCDYRKRKCFIE